MELTIRPKRQGTLSKDMNYLFEKVNIVTDKLTIHRLIITEDMCIVQIRIVQYINYMYTRKNKY
jgi:hypothetical protein